MICNLDFCEVEAYDPGLISDVGLWNRHGQCQVKEFYSLIVRRRGNIS